MEAPGLLTAQEIADLVRVPLSEAYRLGREGNLRPAVVRVGNRMRFRREYVDRWIAAGGGEARLESHQPAGAA